MNQQLNSDIKLYKDIHTDASYALVGFKGKSNYKSGVFYCPYKRPCLLRRCIARLINRIKSIFRTEQQARELLDKSKL